jgi:cell division protein FtsI/penicillin-binding protein 2
MVPYARGRFRLRLSRRSFLASCAARSLFGTEIAVPGCALLLDFRTKQMLTLQGAKQAREWVAAPGSTVKPLSLWALVRSGKVRRTDTFACPRFLKLAGLRMDCSHPPLPFPVDVSDAIAYSCNCASAYFARRFQGGELARFYREFGFTSATHLSGDIESVGSVQEATGGEQIQLQALGERGVRVTALEIAKSYAALAGLVADPQCLPVLRGLEGVVQFGTGQAAQVPGKMVAGKTGSVQTESNLRAAWFAGWAPSRAPEVVVTVLTQGPSGAESAAPVAGALLRRYFARSRS